MIPAYSTGPRRQTPRGCSHAAHVDTEYGMPRLSHSRAPDASCAETEFRAVNAVGEGNPLPLSRKGWFPGRRNPRTGCTINAAVTHPHLRALGLNHVVAEIRRKFKSYPEETGDEIKLTAEVREHQPTGALWVLLGTSSDDCRRTSDDGRLRNHAGTCYFHGVTP
jgi:hypothetical protein